MQLPTKAVKKSNPFTLRHILILTDVMFQNWAIHYVQSNFISYLWKQQSFYISLWIENLETQSTEWLKRYIWYEKGNVGTSIKHFIFSLSCNMNQINISNFTILLKSILTKVCQVICLNYKHILVRSSYTYTLFGIHYKHMVYKKS